MTSQAQVKVQQQPDDSVTILSSFKLVPQATSAVAETVAAAAGVGEFGGAHWFAETLPDSAAGESTQVPASNIVTDDSITASNPATTAAAATAQAGSIEDPTLIPPTGEAAVAAAAAVGVEDQQSPTKSKSSHPAEGYIDVTVRITISADGTMTSIWEIDATSALPAQLAAGLLPSLPRVGVHALVPAGTAADVAVSGSSADVAAGWGVSWYGRGPQECYPDRKTSARLQTHNM